MSRNGSGVYNLPAGNPVVSGTTITASWANNTMNDIASALTGSLAADGQTPATGNLNMANNRITTMADPSGAQDAATKAYVDAKTDGTSAGSFTNLAYTGTLTGGTGVVNIGSGQVYKDASGNVGIGTSSPVFQLDVGGAAANIRVAPSTATNNALTRYVNTGGTGYVGLDSSVGGLTTAYALNLYHSGAYPITFSTSGTERMRITSDGDLLVGTTSSSGKLTVQSSGATSGTNCAVFNNSAAANLFYIRSDGAISPTKLNDFTSGSAANVYFDGSFIYKSTSSLKYKKNIKDATHGLAEVMQLRPVTYEGKAETDTGKTFGGLIAEEVDAIGLTEFVEYAKDGSPDALHYGNMVSLLAKAIQQQQAMIEELKQEVAALKGAAQ